MKETIGAIITLEILNIQGKFTKEEIIKKLKKKMITDGTTDGMSYNQLETYIEKKIDSLAEYGLIGKTTVYYFSV
ncbi:MAG: hypothetical protein HXK70_02245 [Clostridiales bacterium]|nr:hypothetical protein [Clostridiales bacterium]